MKVAIYVENGRTQLVLTPETDWEKQATKSISDNPTNLQVHKGSFYACQGGWIRQGSGLVDDESLMLSVKHG